MTPAEILFRLLRSQTGLPASVHSDEIPGVSESSNNYLQWCITLFSGLCLMTRRDDETREPILVLPMGVSETIVSHRPSLTQVARLSEPASFYLFAGENYFPTAAEEYRAVIPYSADLHITFRSSRDQKAEANGWEFSNNLYVASLPIAT